MPKGECQARGGRILHRPGSQKLSHAAGPAAALLTLAVWRDIDISMAVGLLVAAAGMQAFAYAGFHSYAQDVCPKVRFFFMS